MEIEENPSMVTLTKKNVQPIFQRIFGVHLIFWLTLPGCALAGTGSNISHYYWNFLVNPFSWWQTYTKSRMDFDSTLITIRSVIYFDSSATIRRVEGSRKSIWGTQKIVWITRRHSLVCLRKYKRSDESVFELGQMICWKFDAILSDINIPKAPEKDVK